VSRNQGFVSVRDLKKSFGDFAALNSMSFEVAEGSTLALLGPSGCGKTTMLRCIAGLEEADEGVIAIGGTIVSDASRRINLKPEQRELGIVFQSYAIWPHMTVAENVGFPLKLRRVAKAVLTERVDRILDIVGLRQWRDRPSTQLSGGQQQRVALARAIVHEPRLVLFDEPLSNLDAQLREQMRLELKVLQERLGFTAIYVTHDQTEALALAERIVIMNRGRIDAVGSPEDIFERPPTAFVAKFLGLNMIEGTVTRITAVQGETGETVLGEIAFGAGQSLRGLVIGSAPQEGSRGIACVRREHTRLDKPLSPRPGDGDSHGVSIFDATVKATTYLGLDRESLLMVNGTELRAIGPAAHLPSNTIVQVSIRPSECFIFARPPD
jgi:iron(III) transport system ATP-binding protein